MEAAVQEQLTAIIKEANVERGAAIPILQAVQNKLGYVSKEMIETISEQTGIPASDLYGVATFYSQFYMEPRGQNIVKVCHGTACHLAGAGRVATALEMATGAKDGQTSEDRMFTHERVACLGCCSLAPVVMVNEEVHANVRPERVNALMRKYRKASETKNSEGTNRVAEQQHTE